MTARPIALTLIALYMMVIAITGLCVSSATVVTSSVLSEPQTVRALFGYVMDQPWQPWVSGAGILFTVLGIFGLVLSVALLVSAMGLWNLRRWSYEASLLALGTGGLLSIVILILVRAVIVPTVLNIALCAVGILLMLSDPGIAESLGVSKPGR